jgi:hypothetical protein
VRACLEKPSYDDLKQRCPLEKPSTTISSRDALLKNHHTTIPSRDALLKNHHTTISSRDALLKNHHATTLSRGAPGSTAPGRMARCEARPPTASTSPPRGGTKKPVNGGDRMRGLKVDGAQETTCSAHWCQVLCSSVPDLEKLFFKNPAPRNLIFRDMAPANVFCVPIVTFPFFDTLCLADTQSHLSAANTFLAIRAFYPVLVVQLSSMTAGDIYGLHWPDPLFGE